MKFNLKTIAVAAAMASLAGAAQADLTTQTTNNGTLVLTAFNTVTKGWYMRDLGFTLNSFLPTGVLASVGDPLSAAVGDKTPTTGLNLNSGNTASFGDASGWATWIAGQNTADILWNVNAVDGRSGSGQLKARAVTSSANPTETATNQQVRNFASGTGAGSAQDFFLVGGLSKWDFGTNQPYNDAIETNWGLGGDGNATLGQGVDLYYFAATTDTGSTSATATNVKFGNGTGNAVVKLEANGDFSYVLAGENPSPVPVPAAAWLLGSGLMALGGAARRRKAAAKA